MNGEATPLSLDGLLAIWKIILRRRFVVLSVVLLFGLGAYLSLGFIRPEWRASATVIVNAGGSTVLDEIRGVNEEELGAAGSFQRYFETQISILQSRRVAHQALDETGLFADPLFLGVDHIEDPDLRKQEAAAVDPVERLQEMTSVRGRRNSKVLDVSVDYPNREVAIELANAIVRGYLSDVSGSREETGEGAKNRVFQERESALQDLRGAEQSLDQFKAQHEITSISLEDRQSLITENIITLSRMTQEAEVERIRLEEMANQVKGVTDFDAFSTAAIKLLNPAEREIFDSLREERLAAKREFADADRRYLEKMPAHQRAKGRLELVSSLLEEERKAILRSVDAKVKASAATVSRLRKSLAKAKKKALQLASLEPQYRELERSQIVAARSYDALAKRYDEIGISNRVETEPVKILDWATAAHDPVRPRKLLLVSAAILFGFFIGALMAVIIDLRDLRIRSLPDLERLLGGVGLPVLGYLPTLADNPQLGVANHRTQGLQRDLHVHLNPQSHMAERVRGIRAALTFGNSSDDAMVMVVTSPSVSEGKSCVSSNLALSFCQAGKRVLLVDADLRRPRIHRVFPPAKGSDDVGLVSVLHGESSLEQAVQTELKNLPPNLSILYSGSRPENPVELLEGAEFRKVVAEFREQFDVVILDSPPILPVTDPSILARQVDGVLLVLRALSTSRQQLQEALSVIERSDANLLGAVLNDLGSHDAPASYASAYYAPEPEVAR